MSRRKWIDPNDKGSYSSPSGGRRACLCKDGRTYSRKCCKGELVNQGIGSIGQSAELSSYLVQEDGGYLLQEDSGRIII